MLRTTHQAIGDPPMVLLEFSMAPSTKGESMSPYVARILDIIDTSGLPYPRSAS